MNEQDLVCIDEKQAKLLEGLGVTVEVTYAISREVWEVLKAVTDSKSGTVPQFELTMPDQPGTQLPSGVEAAPRRRRRKPMVRSYTFRNGWADKALRRVTPGSLYEATIICIGAAIPHSEAPVLRAEVYDRVFPLMKQSTRISQLPRFKGLKPDSPEYRTQQGLVLAGTLWYLQKHKYLVGHA